MVQKIHPQGVIWVSPGLVTCQKKNDDLAVQYEDVHELSDELVINTFSNFILYVFLTSLFN